MLKWRLLLGTLLVAAMVGLCWLDARSNTPGLWLLPLALLIAVLGSQELIAMMRGRGLEPRALVVYVANVAMVLVAFKNAWLSVAVLVVGVLAAFVVEIVRYAAPGRVTERLGATVLSMAYVGGLLTAVVELRLAVPAHLKLVPLVSLIAVVKMCDIGAYTVGRLVGRHKMTPVLSPGKTWEGAAGGVAFGCLGAWLALGPLNPTAAIPGWFIVAYGGLISVVGILGDLAESLLKRDLGVKDSSTWMPGFGGVLDIVDSILFSAPVAVLLWLAAERAGVPS